MGFRTSGIDEEIVFIPTPKIEVISTTHIRAFCDLEWYRKYTDYNPKLYLWRYKSKKKVINNNTRKKTYTRAIHIAPQRYAHPYHKQFGKLNGGLGDTEWSLNTTAQEQTISNYFALFRRQHAVIIEINPDWYFENTPYGKKIKGQKVSPSKLRDYAARKYEYFKFSVVIEKNIGGLRKFYSSDLTSTTLKVGFANFKRCLALV